MINVDSKNGNCEFYGDTIDIMSDIAVALSNVVDFMTATRMARENWIDTLDFTLDAIKHAVEDAHREEQNGTFG